MKGMRTNEQVIGDEESCVTVVFGDAELGDEYITIEQTHDWGADSIYLSPEECKKLVKYLTENT